LVVGVVDLELQGQVSRSTHPTQQKSIQHPILVRELRVVELEV
jgi:hypothetical protein